MATSKRKKKPGPKKKSIATIKKEGKEEIFCQRYALHHNGARAAREATYSEKASRVTACNLLTKNNIIERINEIKKENFKKLDISGERVLTELSKLAFVNSKDFYNEDGTLKSIQELTDDNTATIQALEVEEISIGKGKDKKSIGRNTKMKLYNKQKALETLLEYNKLLNRTPGADDEDGEEVDERFL